MSLLVPVAIFGWPLIVLVLFLTIPARRAVLVGMLGAWMFLPMASYALPGVPDITKMSITCVSVFAGVLLFDPTRLTAVRWGLADLGMLAWILAPLPSSISNGYGVYDGLSASLHQFVSWGMPYVIGRLYFADAEGLRELALGVFIGGLLYAPLVLFEARMSPQLHSWVYGFHQHVFAQSKRGDGWRPTVFMQHGLAVAMFMGTAACCGVWLWHAGGLRMLRGIPVWILAGGLFAVAAACRSSYALLLMLMGTAVLFLSRALGTRIILAGLLLIAPAYTVLRTVGGWHAQELRDVAAIVAEKRIHSFEFRLNSEDALWKWVQGGVLFGRGRLESLMVAGKDEFGAFIPDGLWLIALGKFGALGLAAMLASLLMPPALYLARHSPRDIVGSRYAGATVMAAVLILYTLDNLLNAMVNPIYLLGAGGLVGLQRFRPDGGGEFVVYTKTR